MAYKNIAVEETLYKALEQMKENAGFRSFSELIAALMSKNRKKSMLGAAQWLKDFKRDETDREI